ncbi:MAG: site-specific tyrosine recombinase XerD, partial [Comamonas sp.]
MPEADLPLPHSQTPQILAKSKRAKPLPDGWPQPLPASLDAMDLFIDALLLEDGLSRNTLGAY